MRDSPAASETHRVLPEASGGIDCANEMVVAKQLKSYSMTSDAEHHLVR